MATLPRFYADTQLSAPSNAFRYDIHMTDSLYDTKGVTNAANTLADSLIEGEKKFKEAEQFALYHERTNAVNSNLQKLQADAQLQPDGQSEAWYKEQASSQKSAALDGVTDYKTRVKIEAYYNELDTKMQLSLKGFERERVIRRGLEALDVQRNAVMTAVDANSSDRVIKMDLFNQSIDDAVSKGFITPDKAQQYRSSALAQADTLDANNLILQHPRNALAIISDRNRFSYIEPEARQQLIVRAQHALDREKAKSAVGLSEDIQNAKVEAEVTGNTSRLASILPRAADAYGGAYAARLKSEIGIIKSGYDTFQKIVQTTPDVAMGEINKLKPAVGDPNFADKWRAYETAGQRYAQFLGGVQKDPVATIGSAQGLKDPNDTFAAQKAMGVPDYNIRWMSNAAASDFVARLKEKPAMDQVKELSAFKAQFGSDEKFNTAYRDLVRAGLPANTMMIASMGNEPVFQRALANAADIGKDKLKQDIKARYGSGDSDVTSIDDKVKDRLKAYRSSIFGRTPTGFSDSPLNGNKYQFYSGVEDSITTLALFYREQGMSVGNAVEKATQPFLSKYKFSNGIRTPADVNIDRVVGYASDYYMAKVLPTLDISMYAPNDPRNNPSDPAYAAQKSDYLRNIERFGAWQTNEAEDGIVLLNERGLPVFKKADNGTMSRVELKFADILDDYPNVKSEVLTPYARARRDHARTVNNNTKDSLNAIVDSIKGAIQ